MSLDDQKELSRRAIRMWASGNSDTPESIIAQGYINHQESDAEGGVSSRSLDAWKELVGGYHKAFSNSKVTILMTIAESDLVAIRWEISATHTGDYLGLAPTNKEVTWTGVSIDRFENGKIVESWVDWDKYRLFQGLGLVN
jgi:predicted ester cyclase